MRVFLRMWDDRPRASENSRNRWSRHRADDFEKNVRRCAVGFGVVLASLIASVGYGQTSPGKPVRSETSVEVSWGVGANPPGVFQIFLDQSGKPDQGPVKKLRSGNDRLTHTLTGLLPDLEYTVIISSGDDGRAADPKKDLVIPIAPFGKDMKGASGGSGGGSGTGAIFLDDPLARRIEASAQMVTAQGDFLRAIGENRLLRAEAYRSLADARIKVAQAVDLELDNWKKEVVTYFERREENMLGKMMIRDLYDIRADQTLVLRDNAARRRYENLSRHTGNTGGSPANLNFLLNLFVGTSLGYGMQLEDLFDSTVDRTRWQLTPEMLQRLRVKTPTTDGKWVEFALGQPKVMAMHWPVFFQQPRFDEYREEIRRLNDELSSTQDPNRKREIIDKLSNGFAFLTRGFFQTFGPHVDRSKWNTDQFYQHLRAEEFLAQKTRELKLFRANPESIAASRTFDPQRHGKDIGTLVGWMNSRGMNFSKPRPGDEDAYNQTLNMMKELYALIGEPVMEVNQGRARTGGVVAE